MRNWLVLPVWASLGLVVYACDDNSTDKVTSDASADAPVPTGTQTAPLPDADLPDNYVPQKDAGPQAGPVTALVTNDIGAPSAGTDVYFTDPDGTVTKVVTGADGKAIHTMFPGGSLTVNYMQTAQFNANYLTTVVELTPGDTIHVARPLSPVVGGSGQITGTIANAPTLDAGIVSYGFEPYCAGWNIVAGPFPQSYTFDVSSNCVEVATGKVPLLAVARLANPDYAVLAAAPVVVSNPDGGAAVANVAAGDWVAATSKQMTFTGALAAGWNNANVTVDTPRNGQVYMQATSSAAGAVTTPLTYVTAPATFATVVQSHSNVSGTGAAGELVSASHYQRVPSATALAEDYAKLLPRMHDLKMAGTNAAPTFTWQIDAPLPADAFATVPLQGSHTPDGGQTASVYWQIVFPVHAATTSFAAPALPPALLAQVTPDNPWFGNQITVGASAQAPYLLAHQYPTVLASPEQFASQIPASVTFDVKTTAVCANCD